MDIGIRLKIAREGIGYTLLRASEETGIGQSSISEFENSKREPRFSQLSKMAKAYRKSLDFFLSNEPIVEEVLLWRDAPDSDQEKKVTETEFQQLCEQYHRLEVLLHEFELPKLPEPDVKTVEEFDYDSAEDFARKVHKSFGLGEIPIASLKRNLEEVYRIKLFYLDFTGSAISTVSEKSGTAILLNKRNKQWRRSYDLAHELFHILTWSIFRSANGKTSATEEQLATAFASKLLMPEESIKNRIKKSVDINGKLSFSKLDDIAREYDVSLEALIYRMASVFKLNRSDTAQYISTAKKHLETFKLRPSHEPAKFSERYCDLAFRALREGKLSLMQFAKYMELPYRKAQEYLMEGEDFKDEEISIPLA